MIRLGFDIGGTFTDIVMFNEETGRSHFAKVPSTPANPEQAVLAGLDGVLREHAVDVSEVRDILHATTVATNAILERKGSRTALVTTAGFRDVLILGRQKRSETNNLHAVKPSPIVPRRDIFEVEERLNADGQVIKELDWNSVESMVEAVGSGGYEAVAVVLLHSYANGEHENMIRTALKTALPDIAVSVSHEVSPKYREYERTSTTVANAYVKPIVDRYVERLTESIESRGIRSSLLIMQSNGGLVSTHLAREFPIRIVESGPAAGVTMCGVVGKQEGFEHVLTFDMGGTTAKLGAIDDGRPAIMPTFEVDAVNYRKNSGLPLNISAVELLEIGAGGGSIATVSNGLIQVGPESAGATPGPICYGRGGARATITDANLVLGYLDPDSFCGGTMRLDSEGALNGIKRDVAEPLGVDVPRAAWGVHSLATNNMEKAMRIVSIERGRDPRRYAMVAFGGAGPLHAARLARLVGVPQLIIPIGAGVGSAIGLLNAEPKLDATVTKILRLETGNLETIADVFMGLESRIRASFGSHGTDPVRWVRGAYLRFVGQGYELRVDMPEGKIDAAFLRTAKQKFNELYSRNYGYAEADTAVEAIDWYLEATMPSNDVPPQGALSDRQEPGDPVIGQRTAYFPEAGGYIRANVVSRYRMRSDVSIVGPALIEERESTTVILPGDVARVTRHGHMIVSIDGGEGA